MGDRRDCPYPISLSARVSHPIPAPGGIIFYHFLPEECEPMLVHDRKDTDCFGFHAEWLSNSVLKPIGMKKPIITITIENELLKRIDGLRGDVPRSIFIQRILEREIKTETREPRRIPPSKSSS